jgi:hypothetical protein
MNNHTKFKESLQRPYNRALFAKEVLVPVFGSLFEMSAKPEKADGELTNLEEKVIRNAVVYGKITLEDNTEIACYEITLQPNIRIEHNRVTIQQYVRKMLISGSGALINFVPSSAQNVWRLTLAARTDVFTGNGVEKKVTNAKRFTYLLGPTESCKTAAERLEMLSTSTQKDYDALVNAFSVEKLSKDFFEEYKNHYEKFIEYLMSSKAKSYAFNGDEKAIRDFTKKLLGRIVFLYFVQKKGWLGASDTEYNDGPSDFIMQLYRGSGADDTFYQNWLTTLFFDTLNNKRNNDNFVMPDGRKVKIPFLNGGLFDKEEYDTKNLSFKPALFHNPHNDEDAKHRGFLDFLNAYNFTVYEDSPEEHTVAVDPEMLGHIFENLLEDNKDKGTFYTPKEIVHYMTQESLIEYLAHYLCVDNNVYRELGSSQADLFGNEGRRQLKLIETESQQGLTHQEIQDIVRHKDINGLGNDQLTKINELLDKVKICDPAIGSGAFPMGLLHEIFSIKEAISARLKRKWEPAQVKKNIIQRSIYGVDIEKGAVDIARLRFWLSLVVDEEKPNPLPNLDYKIVAGNSLVSIFEDEVIDIVWDPRKLSIEKISKIKTSLESNYPKLIEKQKRYFDCKKEKSQMHNEITILKAKILISHLELSKIRIEEQYTLSESLFEMSPQQKKQLLEYQTKITGIDNAIKKLEKISESKKPELKFFDWRLDFPEVLNEQVTDVIGFDIVIANPPYIKEGTNKSVFDGFRNSKYYKGKMDIWYGFACVMLDNMKTNGVQCFIAQSNWITSAGASTLRNKIISESKILIFSDFGNYKIFKSAGIQTMIYLLKKTNTIHPYKTKYSILLNDKIDDGELIKSLDFNYSSKDFRKFVFDFDPAKYIDKSISFNDIDDSAILDSIEKLSNFKLKTKEMTNGIHPHHPYVTKDMLEILGNKYNIGDGIFALKEEEIKKLKLNKKELSIIKPYYSDSALISQFYINPNNKEWIIYTSSKFKHANAMIPYPNLKKHLDQFKKVITSDNKPYGLHRSRNQTFFCGEKIISLRKCSKPLFAYSNAENYFSAAFYIIKSDRINMKFLIALLNSKLIEFWLRNRGSMQGNIFQIDKGPLLKIPIYYPVVNNIALFEKVVEDILALQSRSMDTSKLKSQIDIMIYHLYKLDYNKVKVIDPQFQLTKEEYDISDL